MNDIDVKTIIDLYDNKIWRCVCALICFEIVEMHRPDRVMRQFKMKQSIPVPALDNDNLQNVTRIGHRNIDWMLYHTDAIRLWNRKLEVDREQHGRSREKDDNYMAWFESITVRVKSSIIHGVGYRPLPYEILLAGQHSSSGYVDPYDVFDVVGLSAGQQFTPKHDTLQSFVDQGSQNSIFSNLRIFIDLLNVNVL
ncbi:serine/threonine-protein phosphatase 7 long form [Dorcoceras hygrometricum]|uniref:Serine/threonine-protein phosphatase 7 long form n=1 Tax=Dorcoceras hygrometricum TaxID=472368 RepID=A0A2Z7CT57_9LAMI|nr:serine/threonine-protein phosphatase 7 long form [Dorcoceras hygrometricum]